MTGRATSKTQPSLSNAAAITLVSPTTVVTVTGECRTVGRTLVAKSHGATGGPEQALGRHILVRGHLDRGHTSMVTTEIERKFLLDQLPPAVSSSAGERLRQGYVAVDGDVNVRVRIVADVATLTVKAGAGLARTEVEVAITTVQAEALWAHTVGRRIEKSRYRVSLDTDGPTAEVDEYFDALAGVMVVEVEFPTIAAATAFQPPDWFGPEVTGDPRWSNAALASTGRPSSDRGAADRR